MRRLDALWLIYHDALQEARAEQLEQDVAEQAAKEVLSFYSKLSDGAVAGAVEDITGERPLITG